MTKEDDLIRLLYDLDKSGYDHGSVKNEISSDVSYDLNDSDDDQKILMKLETKEEDRIEEEDVGFDYQNLAEAPIVEYDSDLAEDNFGGCDDADDMDVEPDPEFMQEPEDDDDGQSGLQSACKFRCKPCELDFNTWGPTKKHIRDKHVGEPGKKVRYDIGEYIAEARHHKCAVCEKSVLQDVEIVMSHVRNKHNMSALEYRDVIVVQLDVS